MATTNLNFVQIVDDWCKEQPERMEAIWKEAAQQTVSIAQAAVPVDTGFLRASVRASIGSMPPIESGSRPTKGGSYGDSMEYVAVIADATLGDTIFVGYTASYAAFVEYGTSRMAPRNFVGQAVAQWPATVSAAVASAKSGQ